MIDRLGDFELTVLGAVEERIPFLRGEGQGRAAWVLAVTDLHATVGGGPQFNAVARLASAGPSPPPIKTHGVHLTT